MPPRKRSGVCQPQACSRASTSRLARASADRRGLCCRKQLLLVPPLLPLPLLLLPQSQKLRAKK